MSYTEPGDYIRYQRLRNRIGNGFPNPCPFQKSQPNPNFWRFLGDLGHRERPCLALDFTVPKKPYNKHYVN